MLRKYPGLALAGGLALAIAIGVGAIGGSSPAAAFTPVTAQTRHGR